MRNPHELKVFAQADELAVSVYHLTAVYPSHERYGLTQQIRRAAVSVPSNIVEGCSRDSQADFRRFIEIATGSAMELQYQLSFADRLGYGAGVSDTWQRTAREQVESTVKALIALGKALRAGG
jgi:four helix bundle protein